MRLRVAALCASVALASPVEAQTDQTTVQACVANATGRVRIVESAAACKRREEPLVWAVAGASGPQGPPGDPGPAGDAQSACRVVARLSLPGIVGEGSGGSIDVVAYSAGVDPNTDPFGPPVPSEVGATKGVDAASLQLFNAALLGTPFASATLEVFGAGGVVALRYTLTSVTVSSFHQGITAPCALDRPFEEVTLAFGAIAVSPGP